jgi:hypothetical protein
MSDYTPVAPSELLVASEENLHPNRGWRLCRRRAGSLPLACSIAQSSAPIGFGGLPNPLLPMNVRRCAPALLQHLLASLGCGVILFSSSRCYRRKTRWQPASRDRFAILANSGSASDRDCGLPSWSGSHAVHRFPLGIGRYLAVLPNFSPGCYPLTTDFAPSPLGALRNVPAVAFFWRYLRGLTSGHGMTRGRRC